MGGRSRFGGGETGLGIKLNTFLTGICLLDPTGTVGVFGLMLVDAGLSIRVFQAQICLAPKADLTGL